MSRFMSSLMGMAAGLSFIVALFYLLACLMLGFSLTLMIYTVIWALAGVVLMRGWRWTAYLVFLLALVGAIAAYIFIGTPMSGPGWLGSWLFTFLALDQLCIAIILFLQIWKR